jgi:hypothetical protein
MIKGYAYFLCPRRRQGRHGGLSPLYRFKVLVGIDSNPNAMEKVNDWYSYHYSPERDFHPISTG